MHISELRKHRSLGYSLKKTAKENGFGLNISSLLHAAGIAVYRIFDLQKKLEDGLRMIYPLELIKKAIIEGEKLPRIQQFRKTSDILNNYLAHLYKNQSTFPTVREILDSLYPEYNNLSKIIIRKAHIDDFSDQEAKDFLVKRYYNGEDISRTGLCQLAGGMYFRWLRAYARNTYSNETNAGEGPGNISKIVEKLTGIKAANFSTRISAQKEIGNLSEYMTRVLLNATRLFDVHAVKQTEEFRRCFPTPIKMVYPKNRAAQEPRGVKIVPIPEIKNNKMLFTDAIIETPESIAMVEVKNFRRCDKSAIQSLEKRLSEERELHWCTRRKEKIITKKTVVIHSTGRVFSQIAQYLDKPHIKLFSPSEFRKSLEIALKRSYDAGFMNANICSPDEILNMYDVLAEKPHLLIREADELKLNFLKQVIRSILHNLEGYEKPIPQAILQVYSTQGFLEKNNKGMFLHYNLSLEKIKDLNISDYVKQRLDRIPQNALFVDVESTGFVGKTIFLIGAAYKSGDRLKVDLAFARNPWEEAAILKQFSDIAEGKCIFTYNGKTFDVPAIKSRLITNMMQEQLPLSHVDVYQMIRSSSAKKHHNLDSLKLDCLIKLFGDTPNGVTGSQVPAQYAEWMLTGNPEAIRGVIERNVKDLISTAAFYLSPELVGMHRD